MVAKSHSVLGFISTEQPLVREHEQSLIQCQTSELNLRNMSGIESRLLSCNLDPVSVRANLIPAASFY